MARSKTLVDWIDRFFYQLADWAINHRAAVIIFCIALLGSGVYFAGKVQTDNSLQSFFDEQDPTFIAYQEYLDEFLSDEISYVLYRVPNSEHGVFDYAAMKKVAALTQALEDEVPFAREATSLANVEFMYAQGDSIIIDELMIDFPATQEELLRYRELVLKHPLYVDYLVNHDGSYGAIILEMTLSSVDPIEKIIYDPKKGEGLDNLYPQVSDNALREILARPEFQGIDYFITGDAPMNSAYNNTFMADSAIGTVLTLVLLAVLSLLLLRVSLVGLIGPLAVVVLSLIMVMGLMGIMGWKLGLFFGIIPTLISAVGVAQSVHIILEYQRELAVSGDGRLAVKAAIGKVGGVCLMAAMTTALGFLVMSISHLKALSDMGVYAAMGVLFTFVLSVTLLVVFLSGGKKAPSEKSKASVNRFVGALVEYCIRMNLVHTRRLIWIGFSVLLVSIVGLSFLKIEFHFMEEFKEHVEWRQHTEHAESVMGGILSVAYLIDTHKENGVKDPELLKAIDALQQFSEQQPYVKNSYSIVDIQKDINRSFHGDDMEWYRVADSKELVAQYFLVYEVSGGEELENFVSTDFSRTVLELRVEITGSRKIEKLMENIENYLVQNPLPGAEVRRTGIGLMWVKIAEYIADTQLYGYSLIFMGITLFLCLIFGSVKVGVLTMLPNVAPVLVVLGLMGWINMPLDYMKLLLATIAIGIAVDDSMHLVTRFRRRFLECGNYTQALELSMRDVGPALIITTIILLGAFSCYLFSDMQIIASFGMLLSIAIASALIADLLFMPALLLTLKPFGEEFSVEQTVGETAQLT
jgi:hypothetical protein